MKQPEFQSASSDGRVYLRAFYRLYEIDKQICAGNFPSVRQLAETLSVNERTIKRDLAVMRDSFNAPIIYDRKKSGFRYAKLGWMLPLTRLSEGDLLAFFIAENTLRLTGKTPEALQLKKSLSKLVSLLPDEVSVNLAALGENISFQNPAYELSEPAHLQKLAESATSLTTVEFDYYVQYRQKNEHRKVDVYVLHNFGGDWYAIGYDHQRNDIRVFHVGRITNLKETNKGFAVRREIWNKEEYLRGHFNMMLGGRKTKVEIWFDSYQAQWIRSRKHFHADEQREELADGSFRLSFQVGENGLEAVARFCLTYAGNCIAERPKKLREIIQEKLKKGLRLHQ